MDLGVIKALGGAFAGSSSVAPFLSASLRL